MWGEERRQNPEFALAPGLAGVAWPQRWKLASRAHPRPRGEQRLRENVQGKAEFGDVQMTAGICRGAGGRA